MQAILHRSHMPNLYIEFATISVGPVFIARVNECGQRLQRSQSDWYSLHRFAHVRESKPFTWGLHRSQSDRQPVFTVRTCACKKRHPLHMVCDDLSRTGIHCTCLRMPTKANLYIGFAAISVGPVFTATDDACKQFSTDLNQNGVHCTVLHMPDLSSLQRSRSDR